MSIDGVDFQVQEVGPFQKGFSEKWSSTKFGKRAALRYEIGISIMKGELVWTNGPFPAGKWTDYKIFKLGGLVDHLEENERVEADDGYAAADPEFARSRSGVWHSEEMRKLRNTIRARQESFNKKLREFGALKNIWRHDIEKHHLVFDAACLLIQIGIENGEGLFDIENIDEYM